MSVITTLNCLLKNPNIAPLKSFLAKHLPNVRGFNGCLSVSVFFNENNTEMLLEEEWLSTGHHQNYLKSIEESGVLAELAAYLENPPSIKYFEKEAI